MTQLDKLDSGQSAVIVSFVQDGPVTRRLMELGLVAGKKITYIRRAPLRDPIQVKVGDSSITMRKSEASLVLVELAQETVLQ
jgi:Fe2+ transport system protein FeoA